MPIVVSTHRTGASNPTVRPHTTLPAELARPAELIDAAIAVNEAPTLTAAFRVLAEAGLSLLGAETVGVTVWDGGDLGAVMAGAGTRSVPIGQLVPPTPELAEAIVSGEPYSGPVRTAHLPPAVAARVAGLATGVHVPVPLESSCAVFHAVWTRELPADEVEQAMHALQTLARLTTLAERSQREREQTRLDSVLESVADGVIVSTATSSTANAAARAILGAPDDLEIRTALLNPRTLDGAEFGVPTGLLPGRFAAQNGSSGRFRIRATSFDGRELVLDGSVSHVGDGSVIVFRDVTDEHQRTVLNERYLYALFNSMPIPLTVGYAQNRQFISANQAFLDLIGYDRDEIAGVTPPFPWWDPDEDPADGFEPGSVVHRVYRRKDGRPLPVEVASHGIPGDDGETVLLLGVITDLSEKRRLDQQLVQSGKLAAIGELAAGVAHEINNPLFAILGLTEFLLKESEAGSRARQRLELIQQTGLEIKEIVRALLDFARENAEERHVVPLAEVIQQTVDLVRRTNAHKGVELVDVYEASDACVNASPNQLKQIFLNLIANARQAMPNGGTVHVETRREGDYVVAAVSDDGPGIEPQILERIFEPFFTTKRHSGGTGLGLSVSLGIAEAHGGTLTAFSLPRAGATFTLRLPIAAEAPA
jgi:PAS domain S-box-containing protein